MANERDKRWIKHEPVISVNKGLVSEAREE
jgi:hypothetical protein